MNNNNSNEIINLSRTEYYGKIGTIFTFRNDFFLYPPFHSYKILDDYKNDCNIIITETKVFYGDKNEGAGHKHYHHLSFQTDGMYVIHIQNSRTNNIEPYTFIITSV